MDRTFTKYTGTFDDGEFPEVLYKYRDWNDKFNKRFIIEREIFMAAPSSFKDKKDCINPIRYELLSEKQTIDYSVYLQKITNPNFTRQQHRKAARDWSRKKLFKNPIFVKNHVEKYNKDYDIRRGVFSLTGKPHLEEMWNEYANNSSGFCVGYNSRILFEHISGAGIVEYFTELPIIFPEPIMSFEQILYYKIYSKEKKWTFENEYRGYSFWEVPRTKNEDRQIRLPKEAYNNIILGRNMSEENKIEITKAIRENIGDIPILSQ